jgi:hypothetical protein
VNSIILAYLALPTAGAGDPETQAADRDAGGTEAEVVEGSVPARGMELSHFEERGIADQQDCLHGKARTAGQRQPDHDRRRHIGDQVLGVPAQGRSRHRIGRQPGKHRQRRDAAYQGDAAQ